MHTIVLPGRATIARQNRSRGPAFERTRDTQACAAAAVVVATPEPTATDGALSRGARRPGFILAPHVAWIRDEARQAPADRLAGDIENLTRGTPTSVADGTF
jgi:phosphoglycerate dehydrogenase-like enzyme